MPYRPGSDNDTNSVANAFRNNTKWKRPELNQLTNFLLLLYGFQRYIIELNRIVPYSLHHISL